MHIILFVFIVENIALQLIGIAYVHNEAIIIIYVKKILFEICILKILDIIGKLIIQK